MVYCAVVGCSNGGPKAPSVRTHSFPTSKAMKEKWIGQLNRKFTPTTSSRVCSKHFDATDYTPWNKKGDKKLKVKRLKETAFPTKHLRPGTEPEKPGHAGGFRRTIHNYSATDKNIAENDDQMDVTIDQQLSMGEVELDLPAEEKVRLLEMRIKHLEDENRREIQRLEDENQRLREDMSAVQRVVAPDQLNKWKNPKSRRPWSKSTLKKGVRIAYACGGQGYDLIRGELGKLIKKSQ